MNPEQLPPINLRKRFFYAVSAACIMAMFLPMFAEPTSAVYVPCPSCAGFKEWCETASNTMYILAGCWMF